MIVIELPLDRMDSSELVELFIDLINRAHSEEDGEIYMAAADEILDQEADRIIPEQKAVMS